MFVCATAVWTVVPAAVVLALPRLAALGTIAFPLLFVAVVAAMVATTKVVAELNRVYCRLTAAPERKPYRPGWRKSFCEPADSRRPTELIENIMAVSAVASVVALGVWFLFFADCAGGACSI